MSCFDISFTKRVVQHGESAYGQIRLGSFDEKFLSLLTFWSREDYVAHWHRSIKLIVEGQHKSCLITSIADPAVAKRLYWWPCYRLEDVVVFQNQILFFDPLPNRFDLADPYKSISDRETVSEDGSAISEWSVPIAMLVEFLARDCPGPRTI
jgi:hypothetical protein